MQYKLSVSPKIHIILLKNKISTSKMEEISFIILISRTKRKKKKSFEIKFKTKKRKKDRESKKTEIKK